MKKTHSPISKATMAYAERRGILLEHNEKDSEFGLTDSIWLYEADNECEPMCIYSVSNGQFFWRSNIYLPNDVKEELPYWVPDEKALRRVIDFLSKEAVGKIA